MTTRRALLKLTAPALAALTIPAAAASAEPLTDLLTALRAATDRVYALVDDRDALYFRLQSDGLFSNPSYNDAPPEIRKLFQWCIDRDTPRSIADVKADTEMGLQSVRPDDDGTWHPTHKAIYQVRLAKGHTKLRWWISEIRRRRAAVEASGYYDLGERLAAARREMMALREQIVTTAPRTAAGIAVLLTVAAEQLGCDPESPSDENHGEFPHGERALMAALRAFKSMATA